MRSLLHKSTDIVLTVTRKIHKTVSGCSFVLTNQYTKGCHCERDIERERERERGREGGREGGRVGGMCERMSE